VAALVDTDILVYRFDGRFPDKQKIVADIFRRGIAEDSVRIPHQAVVEFVSAVTRSIRQAIRGCAAYQMSWFDAHIWAYAEHYGLPELFTEDLQHDRLYGSVRIVNPFQSGRPM